MEYFKNLVVGLLTGISAYLNPISGEVHSLIAVFFLNFFFGLLSALLVSHESFNFRKAWRCIVEATVFFTLICCIYYVGDTRVILKEPCNAYRSLHIVYSISMA